MSHSPDPSRRQRVQAALPLVRQEIRRVAARPEQREELTSVAHEALVLAAARFETDRAVPFSAFARQRIRWALIDHLRKDNRAHRRAKRAAQKLERLRSLETLSPSAVAPEALGDALLVAQERARLLETERWLNDLQAEQPEGQTKIADQLPVEPDFSGPATRILTHLLRSVPPKDRELLHALYREDLSLTQYARRAGISPSTASRRHAKILRELRGLADALRGQSPADQARQRARQGNPSDPE